MAKHLLRAALVLPLLSSAALAAGVANLWLNVPFVEQQKDGCGAAVISMVMQYWQQQRGLPTDEKAAYVHIERRLYSPKAHGIYASAMKRYFKENGYRVFAFAGQRADLAREIAKGRPLIAALKPEGGGELHYVVVVGVDEPDRLILVNDPAQRKLLKEDQAAFERDWKATGNWTLLAVPETHPQ